MKCFFDDYPEFYEAGYQPTRLGARYDAIIQAHRLLLAEKTVLDLGSHNGRWAFAALMAGAKKVISVEGREDMVETQDRIFKKLGVASDRYALMAGDGLDAMNNSQLKCDVVLLLGIYYHIHNHLSWVEAIRETGAQNVIIDTAMTASTDKSEKIVRFKVEDASLPMSSPFETFEGFGKAVGGHPSRGFVAFSFGVYGYSTEEIDWRPHLEKWGTKGLQDYAEDRRSTFLATRER